MSGIPSTDLLPLLRRALNEPNGRFRDGQEEAIRAVVEPPFRAVVVQATGWGKSMVYFLATRVLRDRGRGPTIVVSPLLSLMRNQLKATERLGLKAVQWTSENESEWADIEKMLEQDDVDLVLISPERLANDRFQDLAARTSLAKAGLLVIDEAHCISDWGHDFRPDYQRLGEFARMLPATVSILATTATANDRVVQDITGQLGEGLRVLRGPLARESLQLQVLPALSVAERMAWIADHLESLPGSGIIYTLTRRDANRLTDWLSRRGHNVLAYHAGLSENEIEKAQLRVEREDMLMQNGVKALVATVALGMGFDKPDLGFVIHYQSPGNLVAYYQQVGRAGRAIQAALGILFLGEEDQRIHEWFIEGARPTLQEVTAVLEALDPGPQSTKDLERSLNLGAKRIAFILKFLEVAVLSPIVKVGTRYQRTPNPYEYDQERGDELEKRRLDERQRLVSFGSTDRCLMQVVREELNDEAAEPCGRCANCLGDPIVPMGVLHGTVEAALNFLRRSEFVGNVRKQWPAGEMPEYGFKGKISSELRCEPYLCLSHWGDPLVAEWTAADKVSGHFREDLVDAAVDALRRQGISALDWVCAVPSSRTGDLVPSLAKRIGRKLGAPYVEAVLKVRHTEPQKEQQNSVHRVLNLDGAFTVQNVRGGTCLLVDDIVDSGWTFTVIGALLRQAGAGAVQPLALTSSKSAGDE